MNVGIDFGTTKSAMAYTQFRKTVAIEDGQGHRSIPSLVMVVPDERLYIGWEALNHRARYEKETEHFTISSIKRLIGKSRRANIGNFETSPQEVAALILGALKIHAEQRLRTQITDAVIAVPAHFDINQRWATLQAAELAGLKVHRLLNEASAAVLAFSRSRNKREGVALVFDFGGGTLDVSIVNFENDVYEVLATAGDDQLGGDDFDQIVAEWVVNEMRSRHGFGGELTPMQQLVLREAATRAKIELSNAGSARIYIPGFLKGRTMFLNVDLTISKDAFEKMSSHLLDRAKAVLRKALGAARSPKQFTDVIVIGGTSRMPCIRQMVRQVTGIAPYAGVDSEVGVAEGASLMASVLGGGENLLLLDVTPATYSVELIGGAVLPLISSNTTIPTLARETFTIRGTGDELVIRIYQGDSHMASNNSLIGHVDFSGLQLGTQIEVTFQIDANNTLSVSARHMTTGKNVDVEIKAPHRLSQEELKRMQPWVDQGLCSYREQHGGRRI